MSDLTSQIRDCLFTHTALQLQSCEKLAVCIIEIVNKNSERTEFGQILRGLRSRGIITDADIAKGRNLNETHY